MASSNANARILVAIKDTQEIRSILMLLLLKFVERGSHVVFFHVIQCPDLEKQQVISSIDNVLNEYLASTKTAKVTVSSAVRESSEVCTGIVEEARNFKATMVLLGNSQRQFISRYMSKIGKYCVSNLPPYCFIMVVRKGKVMHVKSGCSNYKGHTLKYLLRKENKQEKRGAKTRTSSSSCSMETFLSFSTDLSYNLSSSSPDRSPDTVLKNQSFPSFPGSLNVVEESVKEFTYEDLLLATENFAKENLVGTGGCSHVYKGTLENGRTVAVKRLLDSSSSEREFSREIKLISHIRHKNLVSLVGFCSKGTHRLLVYNFLQNGSLEQRLYGNGKVLSWKRRQRIALGAARGLHHLHQIFPHHVIHQDMKSSNILLSDDFGAQISDFGLARWSNELTSGLVGTFGYMAPEYLIHGYGNEKTDIHAFGVVLLELISGRAPIDSTRPSKEQSLVNWARFLERTGASHELVDPNLIRIDSHEMRRMMYTAFLCIQSEPENRPIMKKVVELLDTEIDCTEPLISKAI